MGQVLEVGEPVERARPAVRQTLVWRAFLLIGASAGVAACTFWWLSWRSPRPSGPPLQLRTIPAEASLVAEFSLAEPEIPVVGAVDAARPVRTPAPERTRSVDVAAVSPTEPTRAGRRHFVQIGAYRSRANAEAARERLSQVDPRATLRAGSELYYVATGAFSTEAEARGYAADLRGRGFSTVLRSR